MTHINDEDPNISVVGWHHCYSYDEKDRLTGKTIKLQYSKNIEKGMASLFKIISFLLFIFAIKYLPVETIKYISSILGGLYELWR